MKLLRPHIDIEEFLRRLQHAEDRILMLDYDGTLAPFQIEVHEAQPYPGIRDSLDAILKQAKTRLVIVTGRRIEDVLPLLQLNERVEVWGEHGGVRRLPDGRTQEQALAPAVRAGIARALAEAEPIIALGGYYEPKRSGIAVHWRGLSIDAATTIRAQLVLQWGRFAARSGLVLLDFDGGIELRPHGYSKSAAVTTVLSEMKGAYVAAYLGDDQTDEDAFAAMQGRGLSVLVRDALRPTQADVWIQPPSELLAFLQCWREACE